MLERSRRLEITLRTTSAIRKKAQRLAFRASARNQELDKPDIRHQRFRSAIMNSVLSGGLSVALVCGTSVALADADLDADLRKLRGQLVVIQATATPVGAAGPPRSYRMGFVASDDGLVLTTYDLLNSLGQFNSGTLEIKVALATPETRPDRDYPLADIYSENMKHKLLLLHVKGLTRDNPLKLSFSSTLAVGTLLATLGYDDKGKFQTPSGTGATETQGVLWETGI